ncbi:ABC-2 type transporter [Halocaridina rubra]|uniref:ABC-2 type transporter n=1 Tax=Halocaridina rubra TaxID=373956 RepID=A0AAN8WTR1_HALRR
MAIGVAMPVLIPLMIFGGFFMNAEQIPPYFIWIKYISWFNYGNEALIINQWKGVGPIECKMDDPTLCYEDGSDVIAKLSFDEDNMGFDIGLLFVLLVGYRFLGYLLLLSKTYRKKVKSSK